MSKNDFKKTIKKAIFIADIIEKAAKISHDIDDISEGLEEIERSIRSRSGGKIAKKYFKLSKNGK